jgi:predicted kinase
MEAIVFIGLQASGKSSFYRARFFASHVRINLDMLNTRHREQRLLDFCITTQQPFVVDNTNPTRAERERYIPLAKIAKFRVIGYYFQSNIEECKSRNERRNSVEQVPLTGLLGTYAKLELPTRDEGFDELYYVRLNDTDFVVEEWNDEIR